MIEKTALLKALLNAIDYIEDLTGDSTDFIKGGIMIEKTALLKALLNAIDYIEDLTGDSTDFITEEILGLDLNREALASLLEEQE